MRIPEIQEQMLNEAARLRMFGFEDDASSWASQLEEWALELRRKPRATNAPVQSPRMTPELRRRIREAAERSPGMTQHDIAKLVGTNQGRVSETLAGKRR